MIAMLKRIAYRPVMVVADALHNRQAQSVAFLRGPALRNISTIESGEYFLTIKRHSVRSILHLQTIVLQCHDNLSLRLTMTYSIDYKVIK